jgi:type II secretory pathway pseudopilin PulG
MKSEGADRSGFSIIEAVLALGVVAVSLIAILGLMPVSIKTNQNSQEQTTASAIATDILSDLYATSTTKSTSAHYSIPIPLPGALATPAPMYLNASGQWNQTPPQPTPPTVFQSDSRYGVQIRFVGPTSGTRASTTGTIFVWWPATVPLSNASGFIGTYVALDRN